MGLSTIYTVGHSTRSLDELVAVLRSAGVQPLVDVRSVPRSRRHPQFGREVLSRSLQPYAIGYRHEEALGGFRKPLSGTPNGGWQHSAFRGYADYMRSREFGVALERLQARAREHRTCLMCAEAQWWRCHRRLIADALLIRGWSVLHLGLSAQPRAHELTPFAVMEPGHRLTYPAPQGELWVEPE
jgi:uncharacterized protein (DUF488 family)